MPRFSVQPGHRRHIFAAIGALIASGVLATVRLTAAGVPYLQTFDGTPATPQPLRPFTDCDVIIHALNTHATLVPIATQHGGDGSAPSATHPVSTYDDAVLLCNGHVLMAINADGDNYGLSSQVAILPLKSRIARTECSILQPRGTHCSNSGAWTVPGIIGHSTGAAAQSRTLGPFLTRARKQRARVTPLTHCTSPSP
jgi:hypothetical protein